MPFFIVCNSVGLFRLFLYVLSAGLSFFFKGILYFVFYFVTLSDVLQYNACQNLTWDRLELPQGIFMHSYIQMYNAATTR